MPKVYIVNSSEEYERMFQQYGFSVIKDLAIDVPDLICFTGGSDVSPSLYGEDRHPRTFVNRDRDIREKALFDEFLEASVPMVGICRGGQFLNVMNGGKMYQHVENHVRDHMILDLATGGRLKATSTHHQMMRPSIASIIIATAEENGYKESMENTCVVRTYEGPDYEVILYPHTQCLCFQPHPEFRGEITLQEYFFSLINRYFKL